MLGRAVEKGRDRPRGNRERAGLRGRALGPARPTRGKTREKKQRLRKENKMESWAMKAERERGEKSSLFFLFYFFSYFKSQFKYGLNFFEPNQVKS